MLSETENDTLQSLLSFFDDPGDWVYVFNYGSYGITTAERTANLRNWKRIVIRTVSNTTYSVVRAFTTPSMEWEAVQITKDGKELVGDPTHYTIETLFELFRDA